MMREKEILPWFGFWVLFGGAIIVVTVCCSTMIQTSEIKNVVEKVVVRHDAYVQSDDAITAEQKALYLADSTELLTFVVGSAEVSSAELKAKAVSVCQRHDNYVGMDEGIEDLHRRIYLRSTEILLKVIAAGD